jgi:hypothetical protein
MYYFLRFMKLVDLRASPLTPSPLPIRRPVQAIFVPYGGGGGGGGCGPLFRFGGGVLPGPPPPQILNLAKFS